MTYVRILFLLFVAIPILEIWLLIKVGSVIGALPTIALVLMTAVIGVMLLRRQGLQTLLRSRERMAAGEMPATEMLEAMVLAISGVLLLAPGFATDTLGFLGLVPPLRRWLVAKVTPKIVVLGGVSGFQTRPQDGPRTLEGEFTREDNHRD